MARRKSKSRRRGSRGSTRRARSATKKQHVQRTKRTTIIIETQGRGPKRTTVYEDVYEEEEW